MAESSTIEFGKAQHAKCEEDGDFSEGRFWLAFLNGARAQKSEDDCVRYGRWRKSGNEKTCSNCKFIYYSNNDDFNYCPNCGANMQSKAKEGIP